MDAKRKYLEAACPTKEQVDAFVSKECDEDIVKNNAGWTFDPELGFVLKDSVRHDGINKTLTYFHYEETGARRSSNFPDQVSRIHTYGNSFTHCDQVNDEETWQEYLGGQHRRRDTDSRRAHVGMHSQTRLPWAFASLLLRSRKP